MVRFSSVPVTWDIEWFKYVIVSIFFCFFTVNIWTKKAMQHILFIERMPFEFVWGSNFKKCVLLVITKCKITFTLFHHIKKNLNIISIKIFHHIYYIKIPSYLLLNVWYHFSLSIHHRNQWMNDTIILDICYFPNLSIAFMVTYIIFFKHFGLRL